MKVSCILLRPLDFDGNEDNVDQKYDGIKFICVKLPTNVSIKCLVNA